MKRPVWAAAPNFAVAWTHVERLASQNARAVDSLRELAQAHVLAVDAAQVDAIPHLAGFGTTGATHELVEWMDAVSLPFDPLFVDCGGARVTPNRRILGCLLWRGDGSKLRARPLLVTDGVLSYESRVGSEMRDGQIAVGFAPYVRLPNDAPLKDGQMSELDAERIIAACAAERAVAVLSWLESVNVEVIETPLRPKARERELRKGRKIALTVRVKPPKTRRKHDPSQNHRDFSHRFERRGHYKHFSEDTRLGASDPTKLSFVPGRGFVRKIWCPPHVVGPENKPLVPKVRLLDAAA